MQKLIRIWVFATDNLSWAQFLLQLEPASLPTQTSLEMTTDLAKDSEFVDMNLTRAKSSHALLLARKSCRKHGNRSDNGTSLAAYSTGSHSRRRELAFLLAPSEIPTCKTAASLTKPNVISALFLTVVLAIVLCDLTSPVHSSPLPSSSAWSLPTLNYLFKDTKTRSQSNQYKREHTNALTSGHGTGGEISHHHNHQHSKPVTDNTPSFVTQNSGEPGGNAVLENEEGNKVSSTGRLISAQDIRLTDSWGWVRRGASDPQTTTEQRRKQNIRHSKSKHRQRHHFSSGSSASAVGTAGLGSERNNSAGGKGRKRDRTDNLLCPFDEIRGPDKKCRKAPRFSLYRVGRK